MRLIDADALKENAFPVREYNAGTDRFDLPVVDMNDIDDAPTIDPVKHGRWIHDGPRVNGGADWYHCSKCLHPESGVYAKRPYCSMCGAKMDLEEQDVSAT